jgi:DNA-binding transcriptional MerR regulator
MRNITFTISELAKEFELTTRAIRFYEDQRLLVPTRVGSKRVYSRRDRARLRLILRGKRLGFTLNEIRELFELYESAAGEKGQLRRFLAIMAEKREQLERQRRDIVFALSEIAASERHCMDILSANPDWRDVLEELSPRSSVTPPPSPATSSNSETGSS